ncbi:MAG: rhomboid family intramembrane serine protease [Acidobacteriota bacterium]
MDLQNENPENENQPQPTPEEYLADRKSSIRRKSWWAVGIGGFLVFVHLGWMLVFILAKQFDLLNLLFEILGFKPDLSILFRNIFFILGLVGFIGGIWGLYYARSLNLNDIIPTEAAIKYLEEVREITPYYTYILVASIIAVTIVQKPDLLNADGIDAAGLVKPLVWNGEFWRLLTAGTLHGGLLHIYFNGQALYGLGTTVEYLSNRAHLAIVFVLAIISGSLFSLYFMPDTTSVGASGGIMGIIGYAAILGYRRKYQMPPDFLKNMLVNIGFIGAFGLVAYQFIDNFGHLGGLLVGIVYGFLQIPKSLEKDPRKVSAIADFFGMIAIGIFVFTAILSILLILEKVKF